VHIEGGCRRSDRSYRSKLRRAGILRSDGPLEPGARASAMIRASHEFPLAHRRRFESELQEFVRIPSVSSSSHHAADVSRCARWLDQNLRRSGLTRVRLLPTARHPIVYGEWLGAPGKPTVLIYGHYDVQPAAPLKDWKSPPFGGEIRDRFLHGRGASDDKGQLFTHVKAIESLLKSTGRLPVNVKCLFDGEEEIGSPNLPAFLVRNRRALKADVAVMSDTRMLAPDQPALTYSLRGVLALELEVSGPSHDLHSGNFGGAVHNPLQAVCEIVARLHGPHAQIAIPGFYDRVLPWSETERRYLARTGPSDLQILGETGAPAQWGETGYSVYERLTLRPSLSVTGMRGGHAGEGPKSVIPCVASAKLSFRLVPNQRPEEIERLVRLFIARVAPPTVRVRITTHMRSRPALIDRRHLAMHAAATAYRRVFGREPVWLRSGGSIPVVSEFQRLFAIPTVLMGFASPGDDLHGPNEKFSLKNFQRGILTSISFLEELGRASQPSRARRENRTTRGAWV
jgi:acetylornithine deacetylase/succinyl-diaminopimelate desuccinylase-like protein